MRTTLTIDDDVAAELEKFRQARGDSMKELINEALRLGLKDMRAKPKRRERFETRAVSLGRPRIANVDNIHEALVIAEGEGYR